MAKALLVATIGAVCWAGPLTAQDRPDFSGTWTLDPARSTPSGSGLFGTTFTASQDATTLEIARETTMAAVPVGGGPVRASERIWREVFRLDGEAWRDRVASGSRPPDLTWPQDEPTRPYQVKVALLDSVTSATWAGGRLVSTTYRASRLSAPDREPTEWVQRQTIRLTLGLEPDGLLAVERLLIEDPSPWDSGRQEAPRIIRSVYRRDGARQSPPS